MTRDRFIDEFNKLGLGTVVGLVQIAAEDSETIDYKLFMDFGTGPGESNFIAVEYGKTESEALLEGLAFFIKISRSMQK